MISAASGSHSGMRNDEIAKNYIVGRCLQAAKVTDGLTLFSSVLL